MNNDCFANIRDFALASTLFVSLAITQTCFACDKQEMFLKSFIDMQNSFVGTKSTSLLDKQNSKCSSGNVCTFRRGLRQALRHS